MNSDLGVIFVGGLNKNHFQDCEGGDRLSYELPFAQNELIEALLKVNKNLVAVIVSGNAVEMPWVKGDSFYCPVVVFRLCWWGGAG